jgi:hypothetical protein
MIQIRNVPDELHREAKARAAKKGKTLSDYLLEMLERELERPEPEELLRRLRERSPVYTAESAAEMVRAEREARANELERRYDEGRE